MKKLFGVALLTFWLPMSAIADNEPEQSGCFFLDLECPYKQRQEAARVKKAEEEKQQHDTYTEMDRRRKAQETQALEERQAKFKTDKAAAEAAQAKADAESEREERAEQKKLDAKIAAKKARCGNDYKNPSIGMRIERVQECVAPVKMVSQLNRADGVVSSYQSGSYWFNVMSGRVVAWGK